MTNEKVPVAKSENVSKVVIMPYTDKSYRNQDSELGYFAIPVNPETYSENYKVEYDMRRGHGQQGTDPKFKSTVPEELKLEFIFDGTLTIQGYYLNEQLNLNSDINRLVPKQIEIFKEVVYAMNGDIHRPRFLKIFWGELRFPCILTNLDINYTLFNQDGVPIRAKLSCTFVNYIAQEQRVARERRNSPDLSHVRQVKEGDRLDLLSNQIYNNSQLMLQVAKANGLASIRPAKVGAVLSFPPIDKTEA